MKQDRGKLDDTIAAMFSNSDYRSDYLFYAHILGQTSVKIKHDMPAPAGVCFVHDHFNLYINPEEFDEFTLKERLAILKHEMLHIIFGHIDRQEERDHMMWNYSTDCALNQHINLDHLPDCAVLPKALEDMLKVKVKSNESSEFYYELMKENAPEECDNCNGTGEEPGDSNDSNENGSDSNEQGNKPCSKCNGSGTSTPSDKSQKMDSHEIWKESAGDKDLQKDVTKKIIERAQTETIKSQGTVPNECSEWLEMHSRKSELNWKRVLRGIVGNKKIGKRSTIQRRDRRFPKRDDLRGKVKERSFNLLVIADVSGSMSDKAVLTTLGEVRHICDITKTPVDLIQIDTEAYTPEKLSKRTKLVSRKGCGGTELHSAIDRANEHCIDYQAVVVLTDGHLFGDDIDHFIGIKKKIIWLIEPKGTIMDEMNTGRMKAFQLKGE